MPRVRNKEEIGFTGVIFFLYDYESEKMIAKNGIVSKSVITDVNQYSK